MTMSGEQMCIKDNVENAFICYLKGGRYINHSMKKESVSNQEIDGIESVSIIDYVRGLKLKGRKSYNI